MKKLLLALLLLVYTVCDLPAQNEPAATNPPDLTPSEMLEEETRRTLRELAPNLKTNQPPVASRPAITTTHNDVVVMGDDFVLKANESARSVLVMGGNARIEGEVRDEVIVIGGDCELTGKTTELIIVAGNGIVSGDVRSLVIAAGKAKVEAGAKVSREAVVVGGSVDVDPQAVVASVNNVSFFSGLGPISAFFQQYLNGAIFKLRPVSLGTAVLSVAGTIVLFYFVLALVFRKPLRECVYVMYDRPAMSFVSGLLALLALAPVLFLLAVSVVGAVLIPFVLLALIGIAMFGRIVCCAAVGGGILPTSEDGKLKHPAIAFLLGAVVLFLVYLIPVVGWIAWAMVGVFGLGNVVLTIATKLVKERPPSSIPPYTTAPGSPTYVPPTASAGFRGETVGSSAGIYATGAAAASVSASPASAATAVAEEPPLMTPPPFATPAPDPLYASLGAAAAVAQPEAFVYPRAGFWRRLFAGLLDLLIVGIVVAITPTAPALPAILVLYNIIFWTWRGTTVGGTVLGLKVVRLDGEPMRFATALVRGLGSIFSALIFGVGYMWAGWDSEKQSWHDKIAGTTVVIVPRGVSLI